MSSLKRWRRELLGNVQFFHLKRKIRDYLNFEVPTLKQCLKKYEKVCNTLSIIRVLVTYQHFMAGYSSVIYENMYSSKFVFDPLESSGYFFLLWDVSLPRNKFTLYTAKFLFHFFEFFDSSGQSDDSHSFSGEFLCDCRTNSGTRPGHQSDFAYPPIHSVDHRAVWKGLQVEHRRVSLKHVTRTAAELAKIHSNILE